MKKNVNAIHLEGVVYEHKLQLKVTGEKSKNPGTPFISGTIDVATDFVIDNDGNVTYNNIVPVHFTYVVETFAKSGKKNGTYTVLNKIIDNNSTVLGVGFNNATKVSIDTSVASNDFYTERTDEVVSARQYDGGFVTSVSNLTDDPAKAKSFAIDTVLTYIRVIEADPERGFETDVARLSGYTFNYDNSTVIPVELTARQANIAKYFIDKAEDISEKTPFYAQFTGDVIDSTQMVKVVTPGEFGDIVEEKPRKIKELRITNMRPPYDFDDEATITADAFKELLQKREVFLAGVKKNYLDYQAQKNNTAAPVQVTAGPTVTVPQGNFTF